MKKIVVLIFAVLFLSGCGERTELENREFALALGLDLYRDEIVFEYAFPNLQEVTEQDKADATPDNITIKAADFYRAQELYYNSSNKYMDYSHLKAMILGKDLIENQEQMILLLKALEKNEVISRNTLVFIGENTAKETIQSDQDVEGALGVYLNSLYEGNEYLPQEKSVTLGELLNCWHNADEALMIPILGEKEGSPVIKAYQLVKEMEVIEEILEEDSRIIFMAKGIDATAILRFSNNHDLKFTQVSQESMFEKENGQPVLTIDLDCTAKILQTKLTDYQLTLKEKEIIENELAERMENAVNSRLEKYETDILNSYTMLGSRNRDLWFEYENKESQFEKDLTVKFRCNLQIDYR